MHRDDIDKDLNEGVGFRRALQIAEDCWFPADPELIRAIKGRIAKGSYDENVSQLVSDIQSDFALFTYCLKRLSEMVDFEQTPYPERHDPLKFFQETEVETLSRLLEDAETTLSIHDFSTITDVQAERLQESVLSATAAEALSEADGLCPITGYTTGLFRQLGLTLIAWNYPHVYANAVTKITKSDTLDTILNRALGFSPSLLGVAMADRWNLSPEVRLATAHDPLFGHVLQRREKALVQTVESLVKVCEVGEALTRAANPERYPSAKDDWDLAQREIEARIGPNGMRTIFERATAACDHYGAAVPELSKRRSRSPIEWLQDKLVALSADSLSHRNQFLLQCPEVVRRELEQLYVLLEQDPISEKNIRLLTSYIIPLAGFQNGCVYTINPDTVSLFPRLVIGTAPSKDLTRPEAFDSYVKLHQLRRVYDDSQPFIAETLGEDTIDLAIALAIGERQRAGVLLLVSSRTLDEDLPEHPLTIARALNKALMDCLHVE